MFLHYVARREGIGAGDCFYGPEDQRRAFGDTVFFGSFQRHAWPVHRGYDLTSFRRVVKSFFDQPPGCSLMRLFSNTRPTAQGISDIELNDTCEEPSFVRRCDLFVCTYTKPVTQASPFTIRPGLRAMSFVQNATVSW